MICDSKNPLLVAVYKRIDEKRAQYGESWKTCEIRFLYQRLVGEAEELSRCSHTCDEQNISEATDVAVLLYFILMRKEAEEK